MRVLVIRLLVLASLTQAGFSYAGEKLFKEYCDNTPTSISNFQVQWRCSNRGYTSVAQLKRALAKRNPRSKWQSFWRSDEPVLTNFKGKPTFWDCIPNQDNCGIWVKIAPAQFVFIQQLLNRQRDNEWLGIGLTLFCEGTAEKCAKVQDRLATRLPMGELGSSTVGYPPVAPAPPPPLPH